MYTLLFFFGLKDILVEILARLIFGGIPILIIYILIKSGSSARELVAEWAEENDFKLVELSWKWDPGPFKTMRRGEGFFRFVVQDHKRERNTGWVRFVWPMFGPPIQKVKWEGDRPVVAWQFAGCRCKMRPFTTVNTMDRQL
jgi:hypothetical protein